MDWTQEQEVLKLAHELVYEDSVLEQYWEGKHSDAELLVFLKLYKKMANDFTVENNKLQMDNGLL